jgi:hypothetical protein
MASVISLMATRVCPDGLNHQLSAARALAAQEHGSVAKRFAATALARLSTDHEATQLAIAEAGAIAPLVLLLDGSEGTEAQTESAGALHALASNEHNRLAITECDGIGLITNVLACDNERARKLAEGALVRLSIEHANRALIIKKLVEMLQNPDALLGQEQAC